MEPAVQAFLILEIFRLACVLAGCLLAYFGYRLFRLGIYEKQGEMIGQYGKFSLTVRQVGPGIFFALFGVAITCAGFIRKFEAGPPVEGSLTPIVKVADLSAPDQDNVNEHPKKQRAATKSIRAKKTPETTIVENTPLISHDANPQQITPETLKKLNQILQVTNSQKQQVGPQ